MFWVVQEDLYVERGYGALLETLRERALPHAVVKIAPIVHRLLPADFDTNAFMGDISEAPEAEVDERDGVMVLGSVTLGEVAIAKGWRPGTFLNENFDWRIWGRQYGEDALNGGGTLSRFDEVSFRGEAFLRPALDDKSFNGRVMNWGAFRRWRDGELAGRDDLAPVQPDTLVVVAPKRAILAEHRLFVVDGDIVTTSRYHLGGRLSAGRGAPVGALDFARQMVRRWCPARAFVLDVATVEDADGRDRYKVMEPGCINSAGYYDADITRIVDAIEGMGLGPSPSGPRA